MLAEAHGIDSTWFQSFATQLDTKGVNAVRHINSVFHDILKLVPWAVFDRLTAEHLACGVVRSFTARHQLIALRLAQLSGASSLRGIEAVMASHGARFYHAAASRQRSPLVFSGLFEHLLSAMPRGLRRKMGDAVRLIGSTGLHLAGPGAQWARFSTTVFGAKAPAVYDPDAARPVYHAVTAANVNDITAAKQMPIEPGATYVFDLGYYDSGWWAALDGQGCRLVTRFKDNTPLREARAMALPKGSELLSGRIGFLPARLDFSRNNPMSCAVREITVQTGTGKQLRILSNDLDAPAQEIADLYKRRWQIELFFRVMKQTLKITKFIGRSENAVRIQIAVALIAFLLLRMLQEMTRVEHGFLELVRLLRANLMHRKNFTRLRQTSPPPPVCSRQLQLNWANT